MTMLRCHGFSPSDPSFENWMKVPPVVALLDTLYPRLQFVPGFRARLRPCMVLREVCESLRAVVPKRMARMTLLMKTRRIAG